MRAATEFTSVMRRGVVSGQPTVVVHLGRIDGQRRAAGLAVSRAVGNAVTRNQVKRRLRAILADVLPTVSPGTGLVVRARAAAASADYATLMADVHRATQACTDKATR
jgi:ribonuclease P protein component